MPRLMISTTATVVLVLATTAAVWATPIRPTTTTTTPSPYVCNTEHRPVQDAESCNTCLQCCQTFALQTQCDSCVAINCMGAFPGPSYLAPKIHFSSPAFRHYDWHDIAGALTHNGVHHIMSGGEGTLGGWTHIVSEDLVHWKTVFGAPRRVDESHAGMQSFWTPCAGFLTLDDNGVPCAGFRQCESNAGVYGGNPWDVPLEVRCALNDEMTQWGDSEYLFDVFFWRGIPYDPARPWQDEDGKWYALVSTDGCNATVHKLPCEAGGRADMWSSPALRGPKADWKYVGPMFETNRTVLDAGHLTAEFVTIDYVGGFKGDPEGGATRVFFNNIGGNGGGEGCCSGTTGYFIGKQKNGSPFVVDWSKDYSMGMVDWGSFAPLVPTKETGVKALEGTEARGFSMARTLGTEDPNQVASNGRRVMFGWLGIGSGALSLPRELSLDQDYNLLQQFAMEMTILRNLSSASQTVVDKKTAAATVMSPVASQQAEIVATFTFDPNNSGDFGFAVFGNTSPGSNERTLIGVRPDMELVIVDGNTQGLMPQRAGPMPLDPQGQPPRTMHVHAIIDHGIIEVIFNNRTALAVTVVPSSEFSNRIWLYGVDGVHVQATMEVWELETANGKE